jgi:NodT family efflux transporter outer membrane factor (OMF) lipoprotein
MRKFVTRLLIAVSATSLAACAAVPKPPPHSAPAEALGAFQGGRDPLTADAAPPTDWWRLFSDQALDGHIQRALAANTDLRVAVANLKAARASAHQAEAARWPATVIESGAGPDRADRQPSTSSIPKTSYELGATVAFEIDLFRRLSSEATAANAEAEALAAARDAAKIAVVGDTISAYLDLCAANTGENLALALAKAQQRSYELVTEQLRAGEVSPLEVGQARTLLEQVSAGAPVFAADRRRALYRLATLEGLAPGEALKFDAACSAPPRIDVPLPVGDGAALIARRPDVRSAEQKLVAASARIGVARADLYPRILLGGSGGLIAGGADAILTPLITWAFPNQGVIRARIAAAKGDSDAALAAWDGVVLIALREVETALSDYQAEMIRHEQLASASAESDHAVRRASARHRLGADSYLVVIDAERSRNTAAAQLLASDLRLAQIQVALFRALGGGWEGATQ